MGNQTSHKGNMDECFKKFEDELNRLSRITKNLKESWVKPDSGWVPEVLFKEMEITETTWKDIKSMIMPPREITKENKVDKNPLSGKVSSNYQDKDEHIKQLEKNNETLLRRNQEVETELTKLKQLYDLGYPHGLPDQSKPSKPAGKQPLTSESNTSSNSSISGGKESKSIGEKVLYSPDQKFLKKMVDFKSECEEKGAALKEANRELLSKIDTLNARIKDLEKKNSDLKASFSEHNQRPGSGTRKAGSQQCEKQQSRENTVNANGNKTNEDQMKQAKNTEEKMNLMKENKTLRDTIDKLQAEKYEMEKRNQQNEERRTQKSVPVKHEKHFVKESHGGKGEHTCTQTIELREVIDLLKAQNDSLDIYAYKLKEEKDELMLRLSKFAGDKLVENNPAVTDLSDPNRPTKLAEYYSELYDNEWTNAFEALESAGYDDKTAIETLRLTLENVLQFCEGKAELLLKKASDAVNLLFKEYQQTILQMKVPSHLTLPRQNVNAMGQYLQRDNSSLDEIKLQRRWKPKSEKDGRKPSPGKVQTQDTIKVEADNKLKTMRREMASSMVPIVQKAYLEASWANECIDEMKPFILKCLYLGWMMKVQSPPMVFHKCEMEVGFDRNFYKEYVTSGPRVNYVVWPALLLNEDGPLVCKGVAEGKKNTP